MKTIGDADKHAFRVNQPKLDWAQLIERKRHLIGDLEGDKKKKLEERGIDYFHQGAKFASAHEIDVNGERMRADHIIMATGSKTAKPPVEGIEKAITSTEALSLEKLPRSMVVIGGGFIAMEFSHIFASFGVEVTIVEMLDRLLANHDADISAAIADLTRQRGIGLHLNARVLRIEGSQGQMSVIAQTEEGQRRFQAELVMNAAGRVANVDGVATENAGVEMERGRIKIDEYLQTSQPHIYAAGDVSSKYQLTPVASYDGRLAAVNALNRRRQKRDYSIVPSAVFTDPEIASVGLTEEEAREQKLTFDVFRFDFKDLGAAMIRGETEGFVKMIAEKRSGKILGAHIIGPEASELILDVVYAMKGGLTRHDIADMMLIHPSLSEAIGAVVTSAKTGHKEGCCG